MRVIAAGLFALRSMPTLADTLPGALIQAYQNNSQLNAQRDRVVASGTLLAAVGRLMVQRLSLDGKAWAKHTRTSRPKGAAQSRAHAFTSGAHIDFVETRRVTNSIVHRPPDEAVEYTAVHQQVAFASGASDQR